MFTAKIFRHGGSQAVRLPKSFRFDCTEVIIERRGDNVVLKPLPKTRIKTLSDVAAHMRKKFPGACDFPDIERPCFEQDRHLNLG